MPMNPAAMERKIQQMDNDVQAIYEMIAQIDGTLRRQHNRLEEISAELGQVRTRIDAHDARFDAVDARFDTLDGKLDRVIELVGGAN